MSPRWLLLAPVAAHAQGNQISTDPGGGNDNITGGIGVNDFTTGASESTGLTNTLMAVAHYAFYVFYVLGIVFMGIAAIKFKGGDMEAMGKNLV